MNKQTINENGIWIRMLSKMRAYCSMFYIFSTFNIPDEGPFLCLVCQMCQIFGIFERADESALKGSVFEMGTTPN